MHKGKQTIAFNTPKHTVGYSYKYSVTLQMYPHIYILRCEPEQVHPTVWIVGRTAKHKQYATCVSYSVLRTRYGEIIYVCTQAPSK